MSREYRVYGAQAWLPLLLGVALAGCGASDDAPGPNDDETDPGPPDGGTSSPDGDLTIDVSSVFSAGTTVRDAYSDTEVEVDEDGQVVISPTDEGVVLLEAVSDEESEETFSWDNATIYFVMIDRFRDGDTSNNNGYGRDFSDMPTVGTFHGGDLKGLTDELEYIKSLGANAIWITSPLEQIHGFVGGGPDGTFPHFAYAGYWTLDFTELDDNFGTQDEFKAFVDAAHEQGLRVVLDVVMNHPGYATLSEMGTYLHTEAGTETSVFAGNRYQSLVDEFGAVDKWRPSEDENWASYNSFIKYNPSPPNQRIWSNWWSGDWVRASFYVNEPDQVNDLNMSLASLPDFITEVDPDAPVNVELPPMLVTKAENGLSRVLDEDWQPQSETRTVRQYLITWLTQWVRELGIDGFRCDTAKHVDLDAWAELKDAGTQALAEWKENNPDKALDDLPFWMVAEVFPHGVEKDEYYTEAKFDSVINFTFKEEVESISTDMSALDTLYTEYAESINSDPEFNVLSYISSHDTSLYYDQDEDISRQYRVGTAMLLLPGGVKIFYGDESGRTPGEGLGDETAPTRSDMNWDDIDEDLLAHWQKIAQFRKLHPAVAAGDHEVISNDEDAYVFSRTLAGDNSDEVVVAIVPSP